MSYSHEKLERVATELRGLAPRDILNRLDRHESETARIARTTDSIQVIKQILDETASDQTKIVAYRRWMELASNAAAQNALAELEQKVEAACARSRSVTTVTDAAIAYWDAPEGTEAEAIALERALELA